MPPQIRMKNTVENLTASRENISIQRKTEETIATDITVFFIDLSILSPAEKIR